MKKKKSTKKFNPIQFLSITTSSSAHIFRDERKRRTNNARMCVYVCDQPIYFFKSDLWIKYTQTCIQTVDIFLLVWVEDLIPEKKYLLNNTHAFIDGICVWGKKNHFHHIDDNHYFYNYETRSSSPKLIIVEIRL